MGRAWVLFGFSESIGDQLDALHACRDSLKQIVLNLPIDPEFLDARLAPLREKPEIIDLDKFEPTSGESYGFGFYNPKKEALVRILLDRFRLAYDNLIHPSAQVSPYARLGSGVLINALAVVPAYATLGDHVRINRSASIGHGSQIAAYSHIGPSATIAGECRIGKGTFIGAGSTIIDHRTIGEKVLVGAGSVVVTDLADGVVAYGNPAKVVRNH